MDRSVVRTIATCSAAFLLATGCVTEPGTTAPEPTVTVRKGPESTSTEEPFTYRIAIHSDPATDNPWAIFDMHADVWSALALGLPPSLYTYAGPARVVVPYLAVEDTPPPAILGDAWTVTVHLRTDARWSDGEPIDAHDAAFTFETVRDLDLGGNLSSAWPLAVADDPDTETDETRHGLSDVQALDAETLVLSFDTEPGLSVWPYSAGLAPIFPEHFWRPIAAASVDATDFEGASGLRSPTSAGYTIGEWSPGAFVRKEATADYWDRGAHWKVFEKGGLEYRSPGQDVEIYGLASGPVVSEWVEGPHASEVLLSVYSDLNSALLALTAGDVDYVFNPLGLERGLQQLVLGDPNLEVVANSAAGFRYLAFNVRKFPMNDSAFRRAIGCRIDKDFMANTVLGGSALTVDSLVPAAFVFWHNDEVAAPCAGLDEKGRFETAVSYLEGAGWTWTTKPQWDDANRDVIPRGEGLTGPDGTPVGPLELLAPGPGYDPLRATYSLFIAKWAQDLGIPLEAEPTGFAVIIDKVFGGTNWDLYILGWGITEFPGYVFEFFETDGDFNTPGYSNPEFDDLALRFSEARTTAEAQQLVFDAEAIIARDLPYVVLFTTPIIEAYRSAIEFPLTDVIGGVSNNPFRSVRTH